MGQFFPYLVRDVYGSLVIPENLGNPVPVGYNNHSVVLAQGWTFVSAASASRP